MEQKLVTDNEMINIEKLSDSELEELAKHYQQIRLECDQRSANRSVRDSKEKDAPLV